MDNKKPEPDEVEIRGGVQEVGNRIVPDAATQRIRWLRTQYLELVSTSDDGWTARYLDPADGRIWELVFPHSSTHGGGPPLLRIAHEFKPSDGMLAITSAEL